MKRRNNKYSLNWLDYDLRASGTARRCVKYELSGDKTVLHIVYIDRVGDPQFISVFRTSRLCYRIFYAGQLITRKTAKTAGEYLHGILTELIARSEQYGAMTLAELARADRLTYGEKLNIYRRMRHNGGIEE